MKKKTMTRMPLLLVGILLMGAPAVSQVLAEEDLQGVITKLQARYEGLQDLEADFNQVTQFKGFSKTLDSKGHLYLKKGKLRWDYFEPSKQQIFVDGDQVLFYVPEHQQVIKTRLSVELDSQVPIRLLAGTGHLDRDFHIQWRDETKPRGTDGSYQLALAPKTPATDFTEILIEVGSQDFLIRKIMLQEPGGNSSTFEFSGIKNNRGIKDRLFNFDLPKGVVVVEQP
jgi:outer membrane lipoprotein carrier protein